MRISSGFFKWCQIANALSHNGLRITWPCGKTGTDGLTPVANVSGYTVCPVNAGKLADRRSSAQCTRNAQKKTH